MKVAPDEVAVLARRDAALARDAHAARVADHLAHHVLGSVILEAEALRKLIVLPTDRPLGDVVRPLVRCDRGRRIAVLRVETAHAAGNAPPRAGIARRPLFPR